MKKIISILLICALTSCLSQKRRITDHETLLKNTAMFEKFDIELWNTQYPGFKKGRYGSSYVLDDGTEFLPSGGRDYWSCRVIPPPPAYYEYYYEYYNDTGNLKIKGKRLGCFNAMVAIGIWRYYDDEGNLIRTEDKDKKFGAFGYNELLEFLHKEGAINLRTGKNRYGSHLKFFYEEDKRLWTVTAYSHANAGFNKGWRYEINTDTGEVLKKKKLEEYPFPVPERREAEETKKPYKTHKGKTYTKEEWEAFEKQEYEEHNKNK